MANCHGRIVLTRYRSSDEVRLSTQAAAGNLAGNSDAWLLNALNLFKKFPRFESSPGHKIFNNYQITITLLLIDFEAQKGLECRANYRGFAR
jgi:hypothetical protein